ncbi:MAG: hypothetical protein J3Q66DRAFT_329955 [Benniella sp.]|nr:MAG: hypothetical protein J3Q66DRAFT_329955 [Benniella sp.]
MNHPATSSLPLAHGKGDSEDLVGKVLELQEGLKDLLKRVTAVREEHDKKREANEMLQTYINNLMNSNAVRGEASK